jgi:hypothetical protein
VSILLPSSVCCVSPPLPPSVSPSTGWRPHPRAWPIASFAGAVSDPHRARTNCVSPLGKLRQRGQDQREPRTPVCPSVRPSRAAQPGVAPQGPPSGWRGGACCPRRPRCHSAGRALAELRGGMAGPEPGRAWRALALCGAAVFLAAAAAGGALVAWNLAAASSSRGPRCPEPGLNATVRPADPAPELEELRRRLEDVAGQLHRAERGRRELEEALRACEGRQVGGQVEASTGPQFPPVSSGCAAVRTALELRPAPTTPVRFERPPFLCCPPGKR